MLHLPRHICRNAHEATQREWLVTNGIGGFASGTVGGALTRRYHGLLLAALRPPLGRTLLVAKFDEVVTCAGREFPLAMNVWREGWGAAPSCRWIDRFELVLGVPTWRFTCGGALLTRRIWMEPGHNVTYVEYELDADSPSISLRNKLFVNFRDYHALRYNHDENFELRGFEQGVNVRHAGGGVLLQVRASRTTEAPPQWMLDHTWYRDFHLPLEEARGHDFREDHLCAGHCTLALRPGETITLSFSADPAFEAESAAALVRRHSHALERVERFTAANKLSLEKTPPPVQQLALAADQFIVARASVAEVTGHTIIAGYPWFTDWGRDTMIALPGLTLCTGRAEIARQVLRTWAQYIDQGMIPNRFPDVGDRPEYHTADATLWYLWAVDQYARFTDDRETITALFPQLREIVDWHLRGTRHNLRVDEDGLIYAGEVGVNLTWMDAKIHDRVITPRIGRPVELSALWYDGLLNLARLAELLEEDGSEYERLAERTRLAFRRFWNERRGGCYDVLDDGSGPDATVRPNQIFAVSLEHSPLSPSQRASVVELCERELLTWFGLRSKAPGEHDYRGHYVGDPVARDEAYHQGTAWGWLLGPFAIAHYRVHGNAAAARAFLEPMLGQLWSHGLGSLSEIFDGDPPHAARGCIAQAWSVAETLRAWLVTQD